jgi:hypothetical protein
MATYYRRKVVIENEKGDRIDPETAHGILKKRVWDAFLEYAKVSSTLSGMDECFAIECGDEILDLDEFEGITMTDLIEIAGLDNPA